MTKSYQDNNKNWESTLTAAASITDVARMVGLSRARFYQLIQDGVFPPPIYDISTRRPYFSCEQQKTIIHIKKTNLGHNGKPILFYSRRKAPFNTAKTKYSRQNNRNPKKQNTRLDGIIEGLKSLGMEGAKPEQIEAIIRKNYPSGADNIEQGELLRTCYRQLRRQNLRQYSADNVGR